MATHKVTYETTTKPDPKALPTGARVEEISPFPAEVTAHRRTLRVNRLAGNDMHAATVKITAETGESKGLPLTEDQAREIGTTLLKAADKAATERTARERAEKARKLAEEQKAAARRVAPLLDGLFYGTPRPYREYPFRF
ncbi:hypothetical protein [Amycolatopsis sp. lyj-23]|uniref:hypothetical protein n=1 Tax=Amycolatopsis sp. lyj-23 TaxID=2789283 RepID=UPI00397BD93F